jgi:hypothetical protein
LAYQVVLVRRVREQLHNAPPQLRGLVAGAVALLRADPSVGTAAFPFLRGPDYTTIIFPEARGFLDYHIVEDRQLVVLLDLTWP